MNYPSALQLAGVAVLLSGALGIGGCGDSTVTYVPEVVGVVASRELDGRTLTYTLADGRTVTEQVGAFTSLRNPAEGDLLLAGNSPGPWGLRGASGF